MSLKNISLALFVIVTFLTPSLGPAQAAVMQPKTLTHEERTILIKSLLNQVKLLQAQLEIMLENESPTASSITKADYTTGNTSARVQILTYTDLDCPFCKSFHTTLSIILKDNPNIAVAYRHFPLEELHPNAKKLAIAAECVGQLGGDQAFWSMVDSVFNSRQINELTDMSSVPSFVTKAGISMSAHNKCASGEIAKKAVEADLADGIVREVQGTPMSFVFKDGKLVKTINGAQPLSVVQDLVKDLLK
jgi:protein-disulfide isomerase